MAIYGDIMYSKRLHSMEEGSRFIRGVVDEAAVITTDKGFCKRIMLPAIPYLFSNRRLGYPSPSLVV
jgi:hypothetical protein